MTATRMNTSPMGGGFPTTDDGASGVSAKADLALEPAGH